MSIQEKVQIWRQKIAEGTLTKEESREVILALRADRFSAASTTKSSGKKTTREQVDVSDL